MISLYSDLIKPLRTEHGVDIHDRKNAPAGAIAHITDNLREADLFELEGGGREPRDALNIALYASDTFVVSRAGTGIFVGGVHKLSQATYATFGFGTDETQKHLRTITRYIQRQMIPDLIKRGATRVEVRVPTHSPSVPWLSLIGFQFETDLPGFAVNGAPHIQMAITRSA